MAAALHFPEVTRLSGRHKAAMCCGWALETAIPVWALLPAFTFMLKICFKNTATSGVHSSTLVVAAEPTLANVGPEVLQLCSIQECFYGGVCVEPSLGKFALLQTGSPAFWGTSHGWPGGHRNVINSNTRLHQQSLQVPNTSRMTSPCWEQLSSPSPLTSICQRSNMFPKPVSL